MTKRIPTVRAMLREAKIAGAQYNLQDDPAYLSGYMVAFMAQSLREMGQADVAEYFKTLTSNGVA